jgi:hypothetical protein
MRSPVSAGRTSITGSRSTSGPRYYDRIFHKKHPIGHSLHSAEAAHNQRQIRSDTYWKLYWNNRALFSHEAFRDAAQMPLHYTGPTP